MRWSGCIGLCTTAFDEASGPWPYIPIQNSNFLIYLPLLGGGGPNTTNQLCLFIATFTFLVSKFPSLLWWRKKNKSWVRLRQIICLGVSGMPVWFKVFNKIRFKLNSNIYIFVSYKSSNTNRSWIWISLFE